MIRRITTFPKLAPRHLIAIISAVPILATVYIGAFYVRFDGDISPYREVISATLPWAIGTKLFAFICFRILKGWSRYVTFSDLIALMQACSVGSFLLLLCDYLIFPSLALPRSVFLLDWCGGILVVGGLRGLLRLVKERRGLPRNNPLASRAFIVGTNASGEALLRWIRLHSTSRFHVVGFIAEGNSCVGSQIGRVPVVGTIEQTCTLALSYGVTDLLITSGELSGKRVRQIVEVAEQCSLNVCVLPGYQQLLRGDVDLQPRQVSIEDLLRREPVELSKDRLHRWIDDRVLMVTGSAGSIGSEICRQLLQFRPRKLILLDQSETGQFFLERELDKLGSNVAFQVEIADVRDHKRMRQLFVDHRPDIVFHAAAYKHVPLMESNCGEAVKNIVLATKCLADLADEVGVESFVMVSTDKAVNPTNVMGACKRVAELYVQSLAKQSSSRFVTVRFGNVLDSAGSVVPIFREQIARGGPITVTDPKMTRYFMTIPEASQLVVQAGAMGQGGEIFVLDMGDPVRIVDLARDMIHLSGLREGEDIEIEFTGIRPGEKLYEELHVVGERHIATSHPKIMVAESTKLSYVSIASQVQSLATMTESARTQIVSELQRIVPTFKPQVDAPLRRAA